MFKHRFKLEHFVVVSVFITVAILVAMTKFEETNLSPTSFDTHVYFAWGSLAALAVLLMAILFIRLERRHVRLLVLKLTQAVEQSPASVIITDRSGRIEYVNPRFTLMTGYSRREILGKNPRLLKSGRTNPETYRRFWDTLTSGKEYKGEFLNKKKNGEIYWEGISVSPLMESSGEISHYIGVLEDISDRKKIEKLKDALLGMVSHEMRTPLTVIKWSVRSLEDGLSGQVPQRQREIVRGIGRNLSRLEKIINEVLDLSRLESDRGPLNRIRFDLAALIHEALGGFRERLDNGDLRIEEKMGENLVVEADPDKIIQVVNNLVENALRFATSVITVQASVQGDHFRLSVIDDGPGIELEDQKKLFDKFQRLPARGRREQYKGTGLGLAICKEIVHRHDGKIWVESVPGQGARFHFRVPIRNRENREEENHGGAKEANTRH